MEYKDENEDFSYHSLDGLAEEDADDYGGMGKDAVGTSPMAAAGGKVGPHHDAGRVEDQPNWLHVVDCN